ncbi:hypothetical protein D3C78_1993920 [compost metagenome]
MRFLPTRPALEYSSTAVGILISGVWYSCASQLRKNATPTTSSPDRYIRCRKRIAMSSVVAL